MEGRGVAGLALRGCLVVGLALVVTQLRFEREAWVLTLPDKARTYCAARSMTVEGEVVGHVIDPGGWAPYENVCDAVVAGRFVRLACPYQGLGHFTTEWTP